jgi:hypothetical protein
MIRSALIHTVLVAGLLTPVQSAGQITATDAAPFLGEWTLTLQGPNGPGTFDLTVKAEKEKVVGEITNPQLPTQPITSIAKTDKTLVLRYTFTWEGNPVDAAVSLTPADDGKVAAQIDFAGGAYTMTGTAAKKEKSKLLP